jgi:hypothetical protein
MIPLLIKEGLGGVEWCRHADTHHPLPPPPLRRGVFFFTRLVGLGQVGVSGRSHNVPAQRS